jgi:drug/metabolite transporter (DMT)-like permease
MAEAPDAAAVSRNHWPVWFLLLAAIWGMSFVFIKEADQALGPLQVALARSSIGALTLVAILLALGQKLPSGRRIWGHLAVIGLLQNVLPFALFAFAETQISSVLAGIWNAATPLFTLAVAMVILGDERPTRDRIAGLVVGFLGVVVVLGPWSRVGGRDLLLGSLAALVAAACYGLGTPYMRRYMAGRPESGVSLSAGQLLCASAEAAVLAALTWRAPGQFTLPVVASIVALGSLGTGLAYILFFAVIRSAGAVTASTVTYLIPLVAAVAGVLLLGERLAWNQPAGGVIILLGVAVAQGRLAGLPRRPARLMGWAAKRRPEAD